MFDVQQIMSRHATLVSEQAAHVTIWQEIAELVLPGHAHFNGANRSAGSDRTRRLIDGHGAQAFDQGTAVFEGYVMPRGTRWQLLSAADPELMKLQHVAAWYEQKTQLLFERRNDPESGFVGQTHESVASILGFGNQSMWVDLRRNQWGVPEGLRYRSEHIGDIVVEENFQGLIDRTYRKYTLTARNALAQFGPDKLAAAPKVLAMAKDPKRENNECEFIHFIRANPDIDSNRADWRSRPFVAVTISCDDKTQIDIGGYTSSPRTYSRLSVPSNEVYGRGRAHDILPDLRGLQEIALNLMVAAEMKSRPPLGAHEDAADQMIHYAPEKISFGVIDDRGNRMVQPLFEGADLTDMYQLQSDLRQSVDRAFYVDMMMVRQEMKTHITATEIMERNADKGILLAPLARQETEWFTVMLDREIALMAELGDFDDMPGEVREAGGAKQVRHDNPLNRMMRSDSAAGYFRTIDQMAPLAAIKPEAFDMLMAEFPLENVIPALADINAVPASWRATDAQRAEKQEASDQAAAFERLQSILPVAGQAARDLSMAEAPGGMNG